ncbi:MAG: hypothetical protein M1594_01185 [Candidatus Marsarchaeota archaeon]|nr:hypothetical protein [Candidatus Marsarchaeota archaeon]
MDSKHEHERTEHHKTAGFSQNQVLLVLFASLVVGLLIGFIGFKLTAPPASTAYVNTGASSGLSASDQAALQAQIQGVLGPVLSQQGGSLSVNVASSEAPIVNLTATINGSTQSIPAFVYNNQLYIATQGIPLSGNLSSSTSSKPISKSAVPNVQLYVMGYCPFGTQSELSAVPVLQKFGSTVNFTPIFIVTPNASAVTSNVQNFSFSGINGLTQGYDSNGLNYLCWPNGVCINSLHGTDEVFEDAVQSCVLKNYGLNTWYNYTLAVDPAISGLEIAAGGISPPSPGVSNVQDKIIANLTSMLPGIFSSLNINSSVIDKCVLNDAPQMLESNAVQSLSAGVQGSPTWFINGVQFTDYGAQGRTPTIYQQGFCNAMNTPASACNLTFQSPVTATSAAQCSTG